MKKMYLTVLSLATLLAFTGCGASTDTSEAAATPDTAVESMDSSDTENDTVRQTNKVTGSEENRTLESESKTNEGGTALETITYHLDGVEFTMILVEGGTFTMGSDDTGAVYSESPAHTVTIMKDYLLGETEVTEALWNAVMGNTGGSLVMPKTNVTWAQAHDFIDRLNEIAHEQNMITDTENFKLPTEAEWEFAAKGGNLSQGYRYAGGNNIDDVAQTLENTGSSSPVAVKGKQPNELGIYDMSGNAYEWVDDYAGDYPAEAQVDPQNTTPSRAYVKRGGSNYHNFDAEPYLFTTTGRYFYSSTDGTIGFRIALQ